MADERARHDSNNYPVITAVTDDGDKYITQVRVDPVTLRLKVQTQFEITEYTEDEATPDTIVGSAVMMERDDALSDVTPAETDWLGLRGSERGALWVTPDTSMVDDGNSTTSNLGNGAVFTGTGRDVEGYSSVTITIHSDKDSASDGMQFQFSMDNTNWDDSYDFNLDESVSQTRRFQFPVTAKYFRVKYTNGTVTTTQLRIQTILHRTDVLTTVHRVDDIVIGDRSVNLVKSVIIGETTGGGGGYVDVKVNPSGALTVEVSELQKVSTTPAPFTITMTNADTEYSQALPANTKKFTFQCRTAFDIRFAFATGKVASSTDPYMTLKSGQVYFEDELDLTDKILYVACAETGKKLELITWS